MDNYNGLTAPERLRQVDGHIEVLRAERHELWLFIHEPEQRAARKLGVDRGVVCAVANSLWTRRLVVEREERVWIEHVRRAVADLGRPVTYPDVEPIPPRTLQALRGHVMRGLLRELEQAIG